MPRKQKRPEKVFFVYKYSRYATLKSMKMLKKMFGDESTKEIKKAQMEKQTKKEQFFEKSIIKRWF